MIHPNRRSSEQNSAFSEFVVNLFTGAVVILTGFLTFAQFTSI